MSTGSRVSKMSTSFIILQFVVVCFIVSGWTNVTLPALTPFGEQRIVVIPVYTQDYYPEHNISEINGWVFQNASDWIYEMSYERTWLSGEVTPWLYLDTALSSYVMNKVAGEDNLVKDAISKADPLIDFSEFDRVIVLHAGPSWQNTQKNGSFPSSSYNNVIITTMDIRTFPERIVISEQSGISTIVHELCHALGAVDLYNRALVFDEMGAVNDSYISGWCIMASGAHMCLFNKMKIGYVSENDVYQVEEGSSTIDLVGIEQQGKGYRGIKYDRVNDSCYYLIEARNSEHLGGRAGILVTVVDESKRPGYGIVDLVPAVDNGSQRGVTFKVADSFHDQTNDFVMHVIGKTETGFRVSVGTSSCIDTSSNIVMPPKYGADLVYDIDISECIDGLAYCALSKIVHVPKYLSYIDVYKTHNSGKTWTFVYNTSSLNLNISQGSIAMWEGNSVLVAHFNNLTHRQYLLLNWTGNLSVFVLDTETGYFGASCSSKGGEVYISWANVSTSNGRRYVNTALWNGSSLTRSSSYENFTSPIISNPSSSPSSLPVVLCRDALDPLRFALFNFDSSTIIETWRNETTGSSWITDRDVVILRDEVFVTFEELSDLHGDPVYSIRVIRGTSTSGFSQTTRFENATPHSLIVVESNNTSYVGLFLGNFDERVTRLVNLTDNNKIITMFQTYDSLSVSRWTHGGTNPVILSHRSVSGTSIYEWEIFIGPAGPIAVPLYSVITTYSGISQFQFFVVLFILLGVPSVLWVGLPWSWRRARIFISKPYGKRLLMRVPYTFEILLWDIKEKAFPEKEFEQKPMKIGLTAILKPVRSTEFIFQVILSILFSGILLQIMSVPFISSSTYQMMWLATESREILVYWGFIAAFIIGLDFLSSKMKS